MARKYYTSLTEFIFLGLIGRIHGATDFLFAIFLIYTLTVLGNVGIILLIRIDSRLHILMHILTNLSFVDVCYSSIITPKMLIDLLSEKKTICYAGCFLQLYFFIALVTTECILFGLMVYDHYVAICNPLLYTLVMFSHWGKQIWQLGPLHSMVSTSYVSSLPFCGNSSAQYSQLMLTQKKVKIDIRCRAT